MERVSFEWDENKRLSTLEKHGLDFRIAIGIFNGPIVTKQSSQNGEARWLSVGIMKGAEIAVIYTMRTETRRIITVRRARENERREYYACYT